MHESNDRDEQRESMAELFYLKSFTHAHENKKGTRNYKSYNDDRPTGPRISDLFSSVWKFFERFRSFCKKTFGRLLETTEDS